MSADNRSGTCPTGKVRYETEADARASLARVKEARAERPDGRPPERDYYECQRGCEGWHLTSRPPDLDLPEDERDDGESWESYAQRLERRVKEQRDLLRHMNALRADAGNRAERKRITRLRYALGRMTERWETEQAMKRGLVAAIQMRDDDAVAFAEARDTLRLIVLDRPEATENRDTYADGYTSGLAEALRIVRAPEFPSL